MNHLDRSALLLFCASLAVFLPGIGWGLPSGTSEDRTHTFATDEMLPLDALAEMHNTFVTSKPDRNYSYPWFHYSVLAATESVYLVYQLASGGLAQPTPEYPFGLADPARDLKVLTVLGRAISVVMGACVVVAMYYFAKALYGPLAGVLAAVFTMLNSMFVYYARTGNFEVPMLFWTSLGLVVFAHVLTSGLTTRRGICLGVCAGVAMATKDQALMVFLPVGLVLLFPRFHQRPALREWFRTVALALGVSIVTYVAATGMFVDPQRHITHLQKTIFSMNELSSMSFYHPPHDATWAGRIDLIIEFLVELCDTISIPVVLTALAGILWSARTQPRALLLLLPMVPLFLIFTLPTGTSVRRYGLPIMLIFNGFAAFALAAAWSANRRLLAGVGFSLITFFQLMATTDLTYAQLNDTRYAASHWINEHLEEGEHVEYFGSPDKMPPLPAHINSRHVANRENWHREKGHGAYVLNYLSTQGPPLVAIIPDWTAAAGSQHCGDCPPEVYTALMDGTVGYQLAAYFPTPHIWFGEWFRPDLDYPSVAPPVRLFERQYAPRSGFSADAAR